MKKSLYLLSFAVGALVGSAASYFVLKKRFEKIAQEEIDSVKEAFRNKHDEDPTENVEATEEHGPVYEDVKEAELKEYNDILKSNNYGDDNVVKETPSYIRIISPVELGEHDYYRIVGLIYYADGVLADEKGNIVDIEETVGSFALTQFGEYDEDAVHVRNTKLETDYEVLLDERDYSEVFK